MDRIVSKDQKDVKDAGEKATDMNYGKNENYGGRRGITGVSAARFVW
jgi:hypothetical protein